MGPRKAAATWAHPHRMTRPGSTEVHQGFIALNMLMWHRIDEERDGESFMGVERVSWQRNSSILFLKY